MINVYLQQKNYRAAHDRLTQLINEQPARLQLQELKARVLIAQGDGAAAEATLREILQADPNYLNAYFILSDFYQSSQQQTEKAVTELNQLIQRRPTNTQQIAQAHLMIVMLEEGRGNFDAAVSNYEQTLSYDKRSIGAAIGLNNLAWIYADKGKGNLDKATDHARSAITIAPRLQEPGALHDRRPVTQGLRAVGVDAQQIDGAAPVDVAQDHDLVGLQLGPVMRADGRKSAVELIDPQADLAVGDPARRDKYTAVAPDTHVAWLLCTTHSVLVANRAYLSFFEGTAVASGIAYADLLAIAAREGVVALGGGSADQWIAMMLARWDADVIEPIDLPLRGGHWVRVADRRARDGDIVSLVIAIPAQMRIWTAIEAIPDGFVLFDSV